MEKWRPVQLATMALAAVTVVAAAMPWAKASAGILSVTKNGTEGDGVFTLILGLVLAGTILWNVYGRLSERLAALATLALGGIVGAVGVYDWADVASKAGTVSTNIHVSASAQMGLILTTVAGFGTAATGLMRLRSRPETPPA